MPNKVAIWRDTWLPASETFIVNQISAYTRWDAYPLAASRTTSEVSLSAHVPAPHLTGIRGGKYLLHAPAVSMLYSRLLRSAGCSIVHAHFGDSGLLAMSMAKQASLPLIVTFHGHDASRLLVSQSLKGRYYRASLAKLFREARHLIAVSEYVAERLIAAGAPQEKISVIYNGVPIAPSPPPSTRSGILFVGRLVEKKGVDDLLKAVSLLPDGLRETPVSVIGTGEKLKDLQMLSKRLNLTVDFQGHLPPKLVREAMLRADVLVVPSKTSQTGDTEGLPTTLLEAAEAMCPVIATRHAGAPEFLRSQADGLLAPEADPASLSTALEQVLQNQGLALSYATSARARLEQHFNVATQAPIIEDLYDQTVAAVAK